MNPSRPSPKSEQLIVRSVRDCKPAHAVLDAPKASRVDLKGKGREIPRNDSAFSRLPQEIIQQILYTADPEAFDSLTFLNSRWHQASRSVRLYAHQLYRCTGIAPAIRDCDDEATTLAILVGQFGAVARRELFETVMRPCITEVRLLCAATSSSAAFPGGEAFRFQFSSPKGSHLLALSSTRIFIINLSGEGVSVVRELTISKRPVSAAILDDGSILAVLSSNHQVSLYNLKKPKARLIRNLPLDNEARTIALSPGAEVLGAAYEGGVEVYSLQEGAEQTNRRAVNCDTVDCLMFSPDGTILLGTTLSAKSPTTVLISAQHFSTDMPVEGLAQLWTTQVLFPRSSRDSSHASLLPAKENDEGVAWTFTFDRGYETFRAVRVEDLRNGHTYFTGPSSESDSMVISPTALPTATRDGSLVAAGFEGGKVWVYGIPSNLDNPASTDTSDVSASVTPERSNSNASRGRGDRSQLSVPQWQVLSERLRNVFIRGREVDDVPSVSALKFVQGRYNSHERLVVVAGGGVDEFASNDEGELSTANGGGRVLVYDFARSPQAGTKSTITIEIGNGVQGPVEALEEEDQSLEAEVDIVRRRTVRMSNIRGLHALASTPPRVPVRRYPTVPFHNRGESVSSDASDIIPPLEDAPYSHNAPRSRTSLHRAATVSRAAPQRVRYPRVIGPDGRLVSETAIYPLDDGWVPPPPPYTPRPDNSPPLPTHLLLTLQLPQPQLQAEHQERSTNLSRRSTLRGVMGRRRDRDSTVPPQQPIVTQAQTPAAGSPAPVASATLVPQTSQMRTPLPGNTRRGLGIRRRPSRAERSAARNVEDARRRQVARYAEQQSRDSSGKSCVVM